MKFSVPGWNQEMGWSKVFDEFMPTAKHLPIRYAMAGACCIIGIWIARKKSDLRTGLLVSSLWFFALMGRAHEYHYTLYVPMLAYLYTKEHGEYRTAWVAFLCVCAAAPTTFALFSPLSVMPDPQHASQGAMRAANPLLFWAYLFHRPLLLPALIITILKPRSPS
jgi:hypothetical protein